MRARINPLIFGEFILKISGGQAPDQALRLNRRALLGFGAACAISLASGRALAAGALGKSMEHTKRLAFHNLHTGEKLRTEFWAEGRFIPEALSQINHILRDHRTNEVSRIDPALLGLLHALQCKIETGEAIHVISGYRSAASNAMLRAQSGGVANRSLHMRGQAIDIAIPGCGLADLRRAAISLRAGGVGYYPASGFVHVDTGRVRQWS
jgi:uncharacterized protein YcbK (DUF882 family)